MPLSKEVKANSLPKITNVELVDNTVNAGIYPSLKLSSKGFSSVQYSVYLYSKTESKWENVSGGYTTNVDGNSPYTLKVKKPLSEGENSFSIWVKRAGKSPANKEGYDDFISYRINVDSSDADGVLPNIKSLSIDETEQKVGISPSLNLTSTGSKDVEYRAFLFSPLKNEWQDVSGGYTSSQNPSTEYKLKTSSPLHKGENNFRIWVKRAGKKPINSEGYDALYNYKVNVTENSDLIPKISSVNIDKAEIAFSKEPTITVKSTGETKVQYRVYLYSQSKSVWEDVSGGYTTSTDSENEFKIKIKKPLQQGRNVFSIWVKRTGQVPIDSGGFDTFVQEVVNVNMDAEKTSKISSVLHEADKAIVGTKPEVTVTAYSGDNSNISYKTFLYSNKQKKWLDSSSFSEGITSGSTYKTILNTPLEVGTNKLMVWSKRSSVEGDVYEDYKIIEIDVIKPAPMKKTIVVDPGHGGKDSGAVSPNGLREREVALSVGIKLGDKLKANGYDVLYTRLDNNKVNWDSSNQSASLRYRVNFANSKGADMFVSIHCNSNKGNPGSGTETFYSSRNPGKDKALAVSIQKELVRAIGLRDRGAKAGNFYVVNNTKMTSALVELGFINNPDEEAKLKDDSFRDKAANGVANGIFKYLEH